MPVKNASCLVIQKQTKCSMIFLSEGCSSCGAYNAILHDSVGSRGLV